MKNLRSAIFLFLGLGVGFYAGYLVTLGMNNDAAVTRETSPSTEPTRVPPNSSGHYAIGYSVAEDAGLKGFNWSHSEVDDFVSGFRDSLRRERPLVPGKPSEYADLQQRVLDQMHPERGASKKLPATLAPLLDAYREGSYAHNLRIGSDPFPPEIDSIEVRFTSAFIDQTGRPTGEISSDMVLRLDSIDPGLRRTLERARIGGRITAVIPARFLGSSELIRSQVHPDESIVYTLLLDLPVRYRRKADSLTPQMPSTPIAEEPALQEKSIAM